MVAERQRHLTVYEDQVGSTPIHFANEFLRPRRLAGQDHGFSIRGREFESRRGRQYCGIAKRQGTRL